MLILAVSPDPDICRPLTAVLGASACRRLPESARELEAAVAELRPDAVLVDGAAGASALDTIRRVAVLPGAPPIIFLCDPALRELALQAVREGAHDYVSGPLLAEELALRIHRVQSLDHLRRETVALRQALDQDAARTTVVAESTVMVRLKEEAAVLLSRRGTGPYPRGGRGGEADPRPVHPPGGAAGTPSCTHRQPGRRRRPRAGRGGVPSGGGCRDSDSRRLSGIHPGRGPGPRRIRPVRPAGIPEHHYRPRWTQSGNRSPGRCTTPMAGAPDSPPAGAFGRYPGTPGPLCPACGPAAGPSGQHHSAGTRHAVGLPLARERARAGDGDRPRGRHGRGQGPRIRGLRLPAIGECTG